MSAKPVLIYPIILIGGSGTRLWPMSRANYPKQFNKFGKAHSLFQDTILRLKELNVAEIILVVAESNYFLCLDQLKEININNVIIIVEPEGRNTSPAVTVAAHFLSRIKGDDQSLMLVLPADHRINDSKAFIETVKKASQMVEEGRLVLFGVKPTYPATGYGYIEAAAGNQVISRVVSFHEKPDLEMAEKFISQDNYYWNSGIFFFSAIAILNELRDFASDIYSLGLEAIEKSFHQGNTYYLNKDSFSHIPNLPIDIAVMEKTQNAYVFPLASDWSDLGDWQSIYDTEQQDENGNVVIGNVVSLSTKNSFLHAEHKLLATIGIDSLAVVCAKDSVLIANKKDTQAVKELVALLKIMGKEKYTESDLKVCRPWGSYETIFKTTGFHVKHIIVKPGEKLSLQMHYHRSEHWIVVSGIADVVHGENSYQVKENESTFIPKETKHRLINLQEQDLHLIEVQVGSYLEEDDIVRFDDVYGREKDNHKKMGI